MDYHIMTCIAACALILSGCSQPRNPILEPWETPFQVPPFGTISTDHYRPAFEEGMRLHREEIRAITTNPDPATFANTVEALERSGAVLARVSNLFYSMNSSMTNDTMQEIAREIAPVLSKHRDEILLNDDLFLRIRSVYEARETLPLTPEQRMLLTKIYRRFTRGGSLLGPAQKEDLKKLNEELSLLQVKFGEHILAENNSFTLVVENRTDLAGLPERAVAAAAEAAAEKGHAGKWIFTLHKPSLIPFLQYADNRKLREKMYSAYINRGNNRDSLDNTSILSRIILLRRQRASLLGYPTSIEKNVKRKEYPLTKWGTSFSCIPSHVPEKRSCGGARTASGADDLSVRGRVVYASI